MANASLILFVSLAVLTAAKPFNGLADTYERFVENSQPRGIQSRLPSEYQQLYDRIPEVYPRQQYPRVLYQPFARIPEELYNGDILQRQPTADREASILIHKERLQQEDVSPEEKNLAPEKPSLEDQLEKEAPNREQPEELAEEPQQRPDDEKEQPKDDKHEDNPEPEHKPQPKPNPKPEKPRKEGGRPHGKPEKKQSKGRPFGPRRPLKEPEQKDLAIDAKPSAANPKPETPLVQINVQVASL